MQSKFNRRDFLRISTIKGLLLGVGSTVFSSVPNPFKIGDTLSSLSHKNLSFSDLSLRYSDPADDWSQSLPVGNGFMGARISGAVERDNISLNHTWLWRNVKHVGLSPPNVAGNFTEVRKRFFEGDLSIAGKIANQQLGSMRVEPTLFDPPMPRFGPDPFQPAGDLWITFHGHKNITDYSRELDLPTGISRTSYKHNGTTFTREIFASRTEGVIVIRLAATQRGMITCELELSRIDDPECKIKPLAKDNSFGYMGEFIEKLKFATSASVFLKGGCGNSLIREESSGYKIENADQALILLSIATDHDSDDPYEYCTKQIDSVSVHPDFAALLKSHITEHQELFNRVELSLPEDSLSVLKFQYGRYLLMCSSRSGGLPSNLQGIWNEMLRPPWNCDFHHDNGLHDDYWLSETCNLGELHVPLLDYGDRLVPAARIAAKNYYGCRGIFIPLSTGPWARCLKTETRWDEWIGAAAWLAQHYWWRYEFTGDTTLLRERVYPFIKEVALFYEDYLIPDPRPESRFYGKLVPVPSQSPENTFKGGFAFVSLCIGATMDLQLIHDVLTHAIAASEILQVDAERQLKWRNILEQIPPMQIGKHGQLQEWLEDYEEAEPTHRHVSHLFGLFPGEQITLEGTPELARAAKISLERRKGAAFKSYTSHMWARLGKGELAFGDLSSDFSFRHPPFYNSSAIAEMLLQSHGNKLRLLPALPSKWKTGHVKGLRARGGYEIEIEWKNGKLARAVIMSLIGNPIPEIRVEGKVIDPEMDRRIELHGFKYSRKFT